MTASTGNAPGRIFMSYRREDTAYPAGWLYDRLAGHFAKGQVFKDIDSIELGDDFVEVITAAVGSCDVLLALIGDRWLTVTGQDGRRRLDNPGDFVRLEIEAALARDVRVIPILVEGARMPGKDELPESLAKLARRQALELSPSRFDADTGRLLRVLERTITEAQEQARKQAEEAAARQRRQVEQLSALASPPSASAVPTNTPPHDTNGQAGPASSEPAGLQPEQQGADHRPKAVGRSAKEQARREAQETAERPGEVTPSTAHLTDSGAAALLAAGFGALLIALCIDAVTILLDTSAPGAGWTVVAANALGIAVTLSGVRQNAILAYILLWNLAWGIVYWFSLLVPHYSSYSAASTVLVTVSVIAAAGNGVLCIWVLAARAKGRGVDLFLVIFAGLNAVGYALAAIAWAALPSPDRPVWDALASAIIVNVLVGLLAMLRALRPGATRSQTPPSRHTERIAPQI
jgi:TIR domain